MTKNDAKDFLSRCKPGEVITFFLQNGFSVIVDNPKRLDEVTVSSTAIVGVDATGRQFCAPLDYIQLAQIKQNNKHR